MDRCTITLGCGRVTVGEYGVAKCSLVSVSGIKAGDTRTGEDMYRQTKELGDGYMAGNIGCRNDQISGKR